MPTIRSVSGAYRFYFYSFDCDEPPHVHVQRDRRVAKFWLDPLTLASNRGFSDRDLAAARRIIFERRPQMMEAWREHCGDAD